MSENPAEAGFYKQAMDILDEESEDIDKRVGEVITLLEDTDVSAKEVIVSYGARLRGADPFDNNSRRVRSLITATNPHGLDISMEDVIDATINDDSTDIAGESSDSVPLVEKSGGETAETKHIQIEKERINSTEFEQREDVIQYGVGLFRSDEIKQSQIAEVINHLCDVVEEVGFSVTTSDIREGIQEYKHMSVEELKSVHAGKNTEYGVSVDPGVDNSTVMIQVTSLSSSTDGANIGEDITFRATVENKGSNEGTRDIPLILDGEEIRIEEIQLDGGSGTEVTYTTSFQKSGNHSFRFGEESTSVSVFKPADVTIKGIEESEFELRSDDNITVEYAVQNAGEIDADISPKITANGDHVVTHELTIPPESTVTQTVDLPVNEPDIHKIEIGDYDTTIRVVEPAEVKISGYSLSTTGVEIDEEISLSVSATNNGSVDGQISTAIYKDDELYRSTKIAVPGDETVSQEFELTFEEPGEHTVRVNDKEETAVTVLTPSDISVTDFDIEQQKVEEGMRITGSVSVENTGDLEGEESFDVTLNGEVKDTVSFSIPGNTEVDSSVGFKEDVDLPIRELLDGAGKYSMSIGEAEPVGIHVLEPADVQVEQVSIERETIDPGDQLQLSVAVENHGGVPGKKQLKVQMDGEVLEEHSVKVGGKSDKVGGFTRRMHTPGEYDISLNDIDVGTITVSDSQQYDILDADALDLDITAGEEFDIGLFLRNNTDQPVEAGITLYEDGQAQKTVEFELEPHYEGEEQISHTPEEIGQHTYKLNDYSLGEITVGEPPESASVEGASDSDDTGSSRPRPDSSTGRTSNGGDRQMRTDETGQDQDRSTEPSGSQAAAASQQPEQSSQSTDGDSGDTNVTSTDGADQQEASEDESKAIGGQVTEETDEIGFADPGDSTIGVPQEELTDENKNKDPRQGDFGENPEGVTPMAARTGVPDEHKLDEEESSVEKPTTDLLNLPTNTRKTVRFDYVLDDEDPGIPNNVDGAGMVIVNDDHYVGITQVQPRSWSIHTAQERRRIVNQYASKFLSILDFKVQIVVVPREFEVQDHLEQLAKQNGPDVKSNESQLLKLSRGLYADWLRDFVDANNMKRRDFYVITRIKASQINQFTRQEKSNIAKIEEQSELAGSLLRKLPLVDGDKEKEKATRKECLVELNDRMTRIEAGLQGTGITADPLRSRDRVMEVLYTYYNNSLPIEDAFDSATRAVYDPTVEYGEQYSADDIMNFNYDRFHEETKE